MSITLVLTEKQRFKNVKMNKEMFGHVDAVSDSVRMVIHFFVNHKNYNFLACDWFKKVLFSTNSVAKLLSDSLLWDSLLWDSLLLDSLLSDSLISQSHSKM